MRLKSYQNLPTFMQNEQVKAVHQKLYQKRGQLLLKGIIDKILSLLLLLLLSPIILVVSIWIKVDSQGPVFYRQERITQYGRPFKIFKFRTMVVNADQIGSLVTVENDKRITKVGEVIRRYRIDEIPQLLNILLGDMSFVGTRPEVEKYTRHYTDDMQISLLTLAGVTSSASIKYKEEDTIISKYIGQGKSADEVYLKYVLPDKMKYNIDDIENFSVIRDLGLMLKTLIAVIK